jgi:hypothetical protein
MASALKFPISESTDGGVFGLVASKLRTRQQNIAEITEMIHVSMAADLLIRPIMVVFYFLKLTSITGRKSIA